MKKLEYMQTLANQAECHIDTLYKNRRGVSGLSKKLSKRLSKITGVSWLMFFAPEEYGDPWKILIK